MHFTILESLKIINESSKSIDEKQKLLLKAIIDLVCFNGGETYGKLYHVPFINVCNEITKLFINDNLDNIWQYYQCNYPIRHKFYIIDQTQRIHHFFCL